MKKLIIVMLLVIPLIMVGCGKSLVIDDGFNLEDTDSDDSTIVIGEGDGRTIVVFDDDGLHIFDDKSSVDLGKEGLIVKDEDGKITKVGPEDGVLKYDSDNGTDVAMGSDVQLPENWPSDLVLMDDMKIKSAISTDSYMLITGFVANKPPAARNYFRSLIDDYDNYKEVNKDNTVRISGEKNDLDVSITIIGFDNSSVTIIVENE